MAKAKRKYPRITKGGKPGRPPIHFFGAMTPAERQQRHRARNAVGEDWQWLRRADTEFIGRRLALAVFDFAKRTDSGRWAEIDRYAREYLIELEQDLPSKRDTTRRRNDIRDYRSIFD
jgi:hypothetical protein